MYVCVAKSLDVWLLSNH